MVLLRDLVGNIAALTFIELSVINFPGIGGRILVPGVYILFPLIIPSFVQQIPAIQTHAPVTFNTDWLCQSSII